MKTLFGWLFRRWSREHWEDRANALSREGWYVGRTDLVSYTVDGNPIHYAYPPKDGERVCFYGVSPTAALRKAVLYAEKQNRKAVAP